MELIVRDVFSLCILLGWGMQQFYARKFNVLQRQSNPSLYEVIRSTLGHCFTLLIIIWVFLPHLLHFANFRQIRLLQDVGILLMVVGFFGWIWSQLSLGENWSGRVVVRPNHTITKVGPYAYIRHPMYTSFIVLCLGLIISSNNWLVSGVSMVYIILTVSRAGKEEQLLLRTMGDQYKMYLQTTGRFLPRRR